MVTLEKLISDVQDLKKKAKNRRDPDKFDSATGHIGDAISMLQYYQSGEPLSTQQASELSLQLADCWGVLGGIYRRDGIHEKDPEKKRQKFNFSYDAYKRGFKLEQKNSQPNSYNRLNRLISYILSKPELLEPGAAATRYQKALLKELNLAATAIELQLRMSRRRDVWALADLALIRTLLNEGEPESNFADFLSEAPPAFVCNSLLATLVPLSELDITPRQNLQRSIQYIKKMTAL